MRSVSGVRLGAFPTRASPLQDLLSKRFDLFVHGNLLADEGPTAARLREEGDGRALTLYFGGTVMASATVLSLYLTLESRRQMPDSEDSVFFPARP